MKKMQMFCDYCGAELEGARDRIAIVPEGDGRMIISYPAEEQAVPRLDFCGREHMLAYFREGGV